MDDVIDGIARERVESSNLHGLGYDPRRAILAVEFKSGSVIHYQAVPQDLALDFYNAESKGQFFAAYVKGKFHGMKMTGPCNGCGEQGVIGMPCANCGGNYVLATERRKADGQTPTQFSV